MNFFWEGLQRAGEGAADVNLEGRAADVNL